MNAFVLSGIMLVLAAAAGAQSTAPVKGREAPPSVPPRVERPESCDMSVIDPVLAKKNWKSPDGREWTVLKMDDGFAVCLFSSRYLIFRENRDNLISINAEGGDLEVEVSSAGVRTVFLINTADLLANAVRYRGYPLESAYWGRARYEAAGSAGPSILIYRAGVLPQERTRALLRRFASGNYFWSNPDAAKRLESWLLEERGKESWTALKDFDPHVKLMLNLPEPPPPAPAPAEEPKKKKKKKDAEKENVIPPAAPAPFVMPKVDAAVFICGDPLHDGDKSPHRTLDTEELYSIIKAAAKPEPAPVQEKK